jgi:hypothetical protein
MKKYIITIDTETTMSGKTADFAAVVSDLNGVVVTQCAVLIGGVYDNPDDLLFHNRDIDSVFNKSRLEQRYADYSNMLNTGQRMLASVNAVNRWLMQSVIKYNPVLTAYNLNFDVGKCLNTGIDLSIFNHKFCLWYASTNHWAETKKYRKFILEHHLFNPPTKLRNMCYKTNAEVMASFVCGGMLPDEPHTALEDILGYELPILNRLLQVKSLAKLLDPLPAYNWQAYQVRKHFKPS